MKIVVFLSTLIILTVLSSTTLAQIGYYGIDINLDKNGKSYVKYSFTFENPDKKLNFTVLGKIEGLTTFSSAGRVICNVDTAGVTYVNCDLPLTQERRSVDIVFETQDFTKNLGGKFLFLADFSINEKINEFHFSLKLPEGMGLSNDGKISFANNMTTISDGRSIIIIWKLNNINKQSLVFQALYEPVFKPESYILYFLVGFVILGVGIFFIIRRIRKPEEVILSVLDDYEKSVMKVITDEGGEVIQRKVVQQTNLSKAKVSRVVKTLADRGIIEIIPVGRTNKLKIIKKNVWN